MISDDDLRKWSDWAESQRMYFTKCIAREIGGQYVADPEKVLFLEVDERLEEGLGAIRDAILCFAETQCWPELSGRQAWLLLLRAYNARELLQAVLAGQFPEAFRAHAPDSKRLLERFRATVPDSGNPREFIPWLLIDLWEMGGMGTAFLKAYSEDLKRFCSDLQKKCRDLQTVLWRPFAKLGLPGRLPFPPADDAAGNGSRGVGQITKPNEGEKK